eukprot:CAMPEP_0169426484 /NCGR_PEP_ID=MMETSP1042-20121227/229_1 /TAXON_ID=464988 /ORGANISM="Hemiselmis andersenii, Strain CCMP1180" /LENGTH=78 /DNA_ID=CAMNT_0009536413 /DNA_START=321 /DNA_END=554 /DNA_ORIENTATION=+
MVISLQTTLERHLLVSWQQCCNVSVPSPSRFLFKLLYWAYIFGVLTVGSTSIIVALDSSPYTTSAPRLEAGKIMVPAH